MRRIFLFVFTSLVCYCLLSCNSDNAGKSPGEKAGEPGFDKKSARSFIDSINGKFSEQIAAGDSLALASHYWPDAELLLDNSEAVKGDNVLHAWASVIRMGIKEMTFSTTDIRGSSAFLIETGNYEMKDGKKSLVDRGKYVVVWEKRNGEWKLYRDIGCTSLPMAK